MSYFGSIYADMELPHRAKTVYMYLKDRSNAGNTCWPSVRTIAADLKLWKNPRDRTTPQHNPFPLQLSEAS